MGFFFYENALSWLALWGSQAAEKQVFQQSKGAFRRSLRKKFQQKLFPILSQTAFSGSE